MDLYLGHTQAPTGSKRTFDIDTTHPFECGGWFVSHNGVLTNFNTLKSIIKDKNSYNEVDSSIIPAILSFNSKKIEDEVDVISESLSVLTGNFGLCIHNGHSSRTYLARSGCTLYADFLTNDFSSLSYKQFVSLDEGVIYLMTDEGLTSVGIFLSNSPFFIL